MVIAAQATGAGYRKFAENAGATTVVNETGRLAVRLYFSEAEHASPEDRKIVVL